MEFVSTFHNSRTCLPRRALLELLSEKINEQASLFLLCSCFRGKTNIRSTMDNVQLLFNTFRSVSIYNISQSFIGVYLLPQLVKANSKSFSTVRLVAYLEQKKVCNFSKSHFIKLRHFFSNETGQKLFWKLLFYLLYWISKMQRKSTYFKIK